MKARGNDDDPESERAARKRPSIPAMSQSGSFAIVNGGIIGPGAIEGQRTASKPAGETTQPQPTRVSANTVQRLRNHRFSLLRTPDVVTADDEIIQGSLCVGLDCVVNESFGFDTIRLKENNTRIKFDDTSTSAGFPNNDWQLTAAAKCLSRLRPTPQPIPCSWLQRERLASVTQRLCLTCTSRPPTRRLFDRSRPTGAALPPRPGTLARMRPTGSCATSPAVRVCRFASGRVHQLVRLTYRRAATLASGRRAHKETWM